MKASVLYSPAAEMTVGVNLYPDPPESYESDQVQSGGHYAYHLQDGLVLQSDSTYL